MELVTSFCETGQARNSPLTLLLCAGGGLDKCCHCTGQLGPERVVAETVDIPDFGMPDRGFLGFYHPLCAECSESEVRIIYGDEFVRWSAEQFTELVVNPDGAGGPNNIVEVLGESVEERLAHLHAAGWTLGPGQLEVLQSSGSHPASEIEPSPPPPVPPTSEVQESRGNQMAAQSDAAEFPSDALVGSLGELARVLAHGTEVPPEFYFACALTLLGAICSTRLTLDIGIEIEPRLYTLLLGGSYDVKKSTAMRRTVKFFESLSSANGLGVIYGTGSGEGLTRTLLNREQVRQLRSEGLGWKKIASKLGIGVGTALRAARN